MMILIQVFSPHRMEKNLKANDVIYRKPIIYSIEALHNAMNIRPHNGKFISPDFPQMLNSSGAGQENLAHLLCHCGSVLTFWQFCLPMVAFKMTHSRYKQEFPCSAMLQPLSLSNVMNKNLTNNIIASLPTLLTQRSIPKLKQSNTEQNHIAYNYIHT